MTCPSCRADVPPGARFCAACGQDLRLRGDERRIVTVLFADLVGFTALSETRDPEQVKNLVDGCFEHLVARHRRLRRPGRQDHRRRHRRPVRRPHGPRGRRRAGGPGGPADAGHAGRGHRRPRRRGPDADRGQHRRGARRRPALRRRLHGDGRRGEHGQPPPDRGCPRRRAGRPGHLRRHQPGGPLRRARADRRQGPRGARAGVAGHRRRAAAGLPAGAQPGRAHRSGAGAGPPAPQRRQRRAQPPCRDCSSCSARPGSASPAWPRSWPRSPPASTTPSCSRAAACPYGEANVWWPVADALRHGCGIRSSDAAGRTRIALAETAVRTALGAGAVASRGRARPPGPAVPHGLRVRAAPPRRPPRPGGGHRAPSSPSPSATRCSSRSSWCSPTSTGPTTSCSSSSTRSSSASAPAGSWCWPPPGGPSRSGGTRRTAATTRCSSRSTRSPPTRRPSSCASWPASTSTRPWPPRCSSAAAATRSSSRSWSPSSVRPASSAAVRRPPSCPTRCAASSRPGSTASRRRSAACSTTARCSAAAGPYRSIEVMAEKHLGIEDVRPVLRSLEEKELLVLSGVGGRRSGPSAPTSCGRSPTARSRRAIGPSRTPGSPPSWRSTTTSPPSATLDRIAYHYVRAAELMAELGTAEVDAAAVRSKALSWLVAGRRAGRPGGALGGRRAALRRGAAPAGGRARRTPPRLPHRPRAAPSPSCASWPPPGPTSSPRSTSRGAPGPRARRTSRRPSSRWPTSSRRSRPGPSPRSTSPRPGAVRAARRRQRRGRGPAPARLRRAPPVPLRGRPRAPRGRPWPLRRPRRPPGRGVGAAEPGLVRVLPRVAPRRPSSSCERRPPSSRSSATRPAEVGRWACSPGPASSRATPRGRRDGRGGHRRDPRPGRPLGHRDDARADRLGPALDRSPGQPPSRSSRRRGSTSRPSTTRSASSRPAPTSAGRWCAWVGWRRASPCCPRATARSPRASTASRSSR